MRVLNRLLLGAALALAVGQPRAATATPLNLVLPPAPDIFSGQLDLTYTAATGALTADGFSLQIALAPGVTRDITNGTFHIGVITDGTTTSGVAGDDLLITGDIDVNQDGTTDITGPLLSGEISQFGATTSGPGVFEFVFNLTGGALAPLFSTPPGNPLLGPVGVVLGAGANSSFTGSFAVDFDNLTAGQARTGAGNADTAPVPEPGTLLLLGAGMAGLVGFGRRGSPQVAQ